MDVDPKKAHTSLLQQQVTGQLISFRLASNPLLIESMSCTDVEHQIDGLKRTIESERAEAFNNCQTAIACLSNDVKDASSHLTAYDQRHYSNVWECLYARTTLADILGTVGNKKFK